MFTLLNTADEGFVTQELPGTFESVRISNHLWTKCLATEKGSALVKVLEGQLHPAVDFFHFSGDILESGLGFDDAEA